MAKQYTLIDLLYIARKNVKLLGSIFLVTAVISVIVSLLLPKWYKASARLLPPKAETELFGIGDIEGMVPFSGLNFFGKDNQVLELLAMLQSRSMLNAIIDEFGLQQRYETDDIEETREALLDKAEFEIEENGTLLVSIYDKNPRMAAAMANRFVTLLDSLNVYFKTAKARQDRIFIEQRLAETEARLSEAESRLKKFQEEKGAVALKEQTAAAIETAATLQAEIYSRQVELAVKEKELSPRHVEIVQLRRQVQELTKKLDELLAGERNAIEDGKLSKDNLLLPFEELPQLGLEYARLLREVEAQGRIYAFVYKMYEQAKLREAHDTPTLQVLDRAVPPIRKARPKRSLIVIIATFTVTLLTFLALVLKDIMLELSETHPDRFQKAQYVFGKFLRND